jgi:CxxC motif-containing protein (DUF1111 family)
MAGGEACAAAGRGGDEGQGACERMQAVGSDRERMTMKRIGVYAVLIAMAYVYVAMDDSSGAAVAPVPVASSVAAKAPTSAAGGKFVPLYNSSTKLEPPTIIDTPTALITRIADRGRDRHCREWMFHAYEHYLPHYWINRTNTIEVVDTVAKGGKTVTFNMTSQAPLNGPNLRAFFEGKGTVAQYSNNMMSKQIDPLHYQAVVETNTNERRPLKIGDRIEIEFSPFLKAADPAGSRTNYYGTALLYVVGTPGFQPWEIHGSLDDAKKNRGGSLDSFPLPELARSGGMTTRHQSYSDEPLGLFDQLATNMAPINAQPFVLGRRLAHTDFGTGTHSEPDNPIFTEQVGKLGARFAASACSDCKGAKPTEIGKPMLKYLIRVGNDVKGLSPHPKLGFVLQPLAPKGATPEGSVSISSWTASAGTFEDGTAYSLQKPVYKFTGVTPEFYSVRLSISKPYGMGLLEAVDESAIAAIAAGNGGRMSLVTDPENGSVRMGRYGDKSTNATLRQQIAKRLNDSFSITTTIYPKADRGAEQADLSSAKNKLADADLENIFRYYSLRAVPPRRDYSDAQVKKGEALFAGAGCVTCHMPTLKTGPYHPMAELRNQTIHPYTDMLLHDMGQGLADNMGEANATGAEWRTAPLWGLGLISGGSPTEIYLHDGRARSVSEAVLWHGGEAYKEKETFRKMSAEDRTALIKFLKSL